MKVIIIEDEHLTAERIRTLLNKIDPEITVLSVIDSVSKAVQWFGQHESPDLVFMDIQLADGISFDIFDRVRVESPVIFITAYQEYAIRAFKVNSVDYLLKPITEVELQTALEKYKRQYKHKTPLPAIGSDLLENIRQMISKPYKLRFMVKVGDHIKSVDVENILFFYSQQKGTFIHTDQNRNYVVDYTLDKLGEILDPSMFHRINRRYITSHRAITELITLSGSKLKVRLLHSDDDQIYISRDRLATFKDWLDQ
ncbi:MAG: response regulator transcription factor [Bacteroidales bacterium]|nr:response regulator transcription factor [Bacteroidales bacterium]